jgi:hypothetical protein
VALAAASENNTRIVLDPGSVGEFVIRRPAIEAIARQVPWEHPCRSAVLKPLIADVINAEAQVENFAIQDGDPTAKLRGPEVQIFLKLQPNVSQEQLEALLDRLGVGWAAHPALAAQVDSLGVKLVA